MPDLHARAAVCAVPSVWEEPFGLVAVEALAAGRPVVASRTGGLARIVADGETGLLVPPGDAGALAVRPLARALDDPAARARLGAAGRAHALAEYAAARVQEMHYRPCGTAAAGGGLERRVAFVDLVFNWPPNGGADADLYHVITGLQREGRRCACSHPARGGQFGREVVHGIRSRHAAVVPQQPPERGRRGRALPGGRGGVGTGCRLADPRVLPQTACHARWRDSPSWAGTTPTS